MKQPSIINRVEDNGCLMFTLVNADSSLANSLRRYILSEIPVCCIRTETEAVNQCHIEINTSRLHNEILKQRLSCIPIHSTNLSLLPGKYQLVVDVENTTDHVMYVTSEHFKVKQKQNQNDEETVMDNYMSSDEVHSLFPPSKFGDYIDFVRLRPSWGDMPGERIKLTADFSVSNSKTNSMFNAVSKCSFSNTIDSKRVEDTLEVKRKEWRSSGISDADIAFQERNFMLLDAHRLFVENSYDFIIESIGIYDNWTLVQMAIQGLVQQFKEFSMGIQLDKISILPVSSDTYEIILNDKDSTFGKLLEYALYTHSFLENKNLSFVSYLHSHPHSTFSVVRIAPIVTEQTASPSETNKKAILESSSMIIDTLLKLL